jgi:hypothetical protein
MARAMEDYSRHNTYEGHIARSTPAANKKLTLVGSVFYDTRLAWLRDDTYGYRREHQTHRRYISLEDERTRNDLITH